MQRPSLSLLSALLLLIVATTTFAQTYDTYHLYSSKEIHSLLNSWKQDYPNLIKVTTSQREFGLPTAGDSSDCPHDVGVTGCLNYYGVVQDYAKHPLGSDSSNRLPTILLSGELHGNERVGPTSVIEATRLLLEAAACEAYPRFTTDSTQYHADATLATQCQTTLQETYGMTSSQRQWLARLASTRRVLLVPTANALGYYRDERNEGNTDPNRDFPYDQLTGDSCMKTVAARTLNELFRQYLIVNSFTFHGGTELLGYEWGNPTWYGTVSPDDVAQDQLAAGYSDYGGGFVGSNGRPHANYQYGDMNSIIYYVRGGFEDFAYAGSWDPAHMVVCQPTTLGGYGASKTVYEDGMLRSFNMLVETSQQKTPDDDDLGTTLNVLYKDSATRRRRRHLRSGHYYRAAQTQTKQERNPNGHVPRNVRLSVASIDLTLPYVRITSVHDVALSDDVVPLTAPLDTHTVCSSKAFMLDHSQRLIHQAVATGALPVVTASRYINPLLKWTVGGSISIDRTVLWVAAVDDATVAAMDGTQWLSNYICGKGQQPLDPAAIKASFIQQGWAQYGSGYFSDSGAQPGGNDMGPQFSSTLDLVSLGVTQATTLIVMASAQVDSSWATLPTDAQVGPSDTNPQSHMVQLRTNDNWSHTNTQGHVVQGQSEWWSKPVLLRLVDDSSAGTMHVNDRNQDPAERPVPVDWPAAAQVAVEAHEATTGATEAPTPVPGWSPPLVTVNGVPQEAAAKQAKPNPAPSQSLADALRMHNRLTTPSPKGNPDGGGFRRQLDTSEEKPMKQRKRAGQSTRRRRRASRIPLEDLPERP